MKNKIASQLLKKFATCYSSEQAQKLCNKKERTAPKWLRINLNQLRWRTLMKEPFSLIKTNANRADPFLSCKNIHPYLHNSLSSVLQLLISCSCSPSIGSLVGRSSSRSEAESASLILLRRLPAADAPPTTTRPRQYGLFIEALLQKLIYWQGN